MTLCIWVCSVKTQTSGDLKQLISDVFNSYSNKIRPVLNQSDPLNLDVSFYLSSITEVNEVKEKLVTTGYLELSWTDEHLTWTPSDYNNTQEIFVPQVYKIKIQFDSVTVYYYWIFCALFIFLINAYSGRNGVGKGGGVITKKVILII